jgi:antitoxin ParD1/3/4
MSTNAMETMNIALPKPMKTFVQSQVARRGYSSVSEYVRELIRADQDDRARTALEAEILKGLQSGKPTPMTREDWKAIREEVRKRHAKR